MMSKLRKMWSCICSKSDITDSTEALNDFDEIHKDDGIGPGGTGTLGTELLQSSPMRGSDDNGSTGTREPADSTDEILDQDSGFDVAFTEMQELQDDQGELVKCFKSLTTFHQSNYQVITEALQEELGRCDLLEEQLTDFAELFQNDILNLTEELASTEKKIAHQSHERANNIHEALKACQSLIASMEQQQLKSLESTAAQTLLGKLTDVLLVILVVLLACVATAVNHLVPLMKTPGRMLSTLLFVVLFRFLWRLCDPILEYPEFSLPSTS